jgi:hypothetical protein
VSMVEDKTRVADRRSLARTCNARERESHTPWETAASPGLPFQVME